MSSIYQWRSQDFCFEARIKSNEQEDFCPFCTIFSRFSVDEIGVCPTPLDTPEVGFFIFDRDRTHLSERSEKEFFCLSVVFLLIWFFLDGIGGHGPNDVPLATYWLPHLAIESITRQWDTYATAGKSEQITSMCTRYVTFPILLALAVKHVIQSFYSSTTRCRRSFADWYDQPNGSAASYTSAALMIRRILYVTSQWRCHGNGRCPHRVLRVCLCILFVTCVSATLRASVISKCTSCWTLISSLFASSAVRDLFQTCKCMF